jgi:PA14 domain/Bacterial TSP3 repeat
LAFAAPRVSSAGVVEPQWSWINVNFDTQSRPGLIGPAGGTNMTWNESIGTAGLTKSGLLNSNGVATSVGFTCSANCMGTWGNPPLPVLTSAAFSWVNNTPSDLVISGLTPGKKYVLYVASHYPNELGGRSLFSTTNATTTSSPQLVDNGGPNGKTFRWLRGVNYVRFDKIVPDATNSIKLTMTSGSDLQRSYINGFQLIEDPSANTCSYATWLAGFNFSGISNPDLTLEGDSDRDSYSNMEEFELGLSPTVGNRRAGFLTTDFWNGISGFAVGDFLASFKYFNEPDSVTLKPLSALKFNAPYSGSRSRGYITPTVTGDYTFWLSARTSANLLLSTDLSQGKYAKRKIAAIGTDLGHGAGIGWNEPNLWDRFASQQSAPVHLDAGQSYYLEMDQVSASQVESQTNLAWACNGGAREVIPDARLSTYAKTPDDFEDDCLPDAWESQYGLSVTDNGALDPARQGEAGDYDGDGLTNREEYLLGTNPANSDTDGDGISDLTEVNVLGTNALVSNVVQDTLLSTVSLANVVSSSTGWTMTSGGLISDSFRGEAAWNFSVPTAGFWLFSLNTELMGSAYGNEEVPVVLKVDGKPVARRQIRYGSARLGSLQILSPWLTAGSHQVSVLVDNMLARRTVRLVSLQIFTPADATGFLARDNRVISHPATSRTSPAFIEGYARDTGSVTVNGIAASEGTGGGHWYANLALANQATAQAHTIHFETGADTPGSFTWQATNVLDAEVLTIRQGDTLRLGAWGADPNKVATLNFPSGTSTTLIGSATCLQTFSAFGTFQITGSLQGGTAATLTVKVIPAPGFPFGTVDALDGCNRMLYASAAPEIAFDTPSSNARLVSIRSNDYATISILPKSSESFGVAGRLFTGGPIMAVQRINVIGLSDAMQNDLTSGAAGNLSGYKIVNVPLTVVSLPSGARIDVTIFRSGVMFANGSTLRSIYPADLHNGWINLEFLFPIGQPGGYCHSLQVYDRNGAYIGTR